jgi:hypothetical protein
MKQITLLCTTIELHCFFPTAQLLEVTNIHKDLNRLKIKSEENVIEIEHYREDIFEKIGELGLDDIFAMKSLYTDPVEGTTIICDRYLWYRFYFPLLKNHKEQFDKLEQIYVERNVQIFFSFAFLEAVNYEDEEEWFLYDFKFKHIKTSDYELFKDKKNFYYDSFYLMFHLFAEGQMTKYLYPNVKHGYSEYHIDFKKIFINFNINNRLNRPAIYSHTCLKPRYHRILFLLEADKYGLLTYNINNVNKQFLEEYKLATETGYIYTDATNRHNQNHLKYFNKEWYDKFLNIVHKITITKDDHDFLYDHMLNYYKGEEYNESYIDVAGETHCIFDLKHGFFTEKSIKPIMSEKFAMIYGSKKVYEEYKRIGIDLFLDDFGLTGIEDKTELEQIDMIVKALSKIGNNQDKLKNFYIKKYDTIKNNKQKLFEYYCSLINKINVLFLEDKQNKLL